MMELVLNGNGFLVIPYEGRQKMLVLSRQKDESIMIGDEVKITIIDVRGHKVRIGITAPKHTPVHRREIYDAIKKKEVDRAEKERSEKQNPINKPSDHHSESEWEETLPQPR